MAGASRFVSCESISSAKVVEKKKPPKKWTISEVFRKFFGSFLASCGSYSAALYRYIRNVRSENLSGPK